jgi:hypothetical protein
MGSIQYYARQYWHVPLKKLMNLFTASSLAADAFDQFFGGD